MLLPLNLGCLLKASIDVLPGFSKLFSWAAKKRCFIETFLYNFGCVLAVATAAAL